MADFFCDNDLTLLDLFAAARFHVATTAFEQQLII
jgi:hypothetical protein